MPSFRLYRYLAARWPVSFIDDPPELPPAEELKRHTDRIIRKIEQQAFTNISVAASNEAFASRVIEKLMADVNRKFPLAEILKEIEASVTVMDAATLAVQHADLSNSFIIQGAKQTAAGMYRGVPIRLNPYLPRDSFLAHMADGSSVMHYANRRKVRCLKE